MSFLISPLVPKLLFKDKFSTTVIFLLHKKMHRPLRTDNSSRMMLCSTSLARVKNCNFCNLLLLTSPGSLYHSSGCRQWGCFFFLSISSIHRVQTDSSSSESESESESELLLLLVSRKSTASCKKEKPKRTCSSLHQLQTSTEEKNTWYPPPHHEKISVSYFNLLVYSN